MQVSDSHSAKGKLGACATLFNEAQSRIVLSVSPEDAAAVQEKLTAAGIPHTVLGTVGGSELSIRLGETDHSWPIADLHDLWFHAISRAMGSDAAPERVPSL